MSLSVGVSLNVGGKSATAKDSATGTSQAQTDPPIVIFSTQDDHRDMRKPDQWGSLRAWGWGASRGLDYLETDPAVNAKRVGIDGVSRDGKAALVTMAFDQRSAMVLVVSSGEGGASLYRRNFGEAVENLTGSGEYHWMAGNGWLPSVADSEQRPRRLIRLRQEDLSELHFIQAGLISDCRTRIGSRMTRPEDL